jgi:sulfate adenylyltransferase
MSRLAEPHAGILVNRTVDEEDAEALRQRAGNLPAIALARREAADLELIATGAASPLQGFMALRDYRSVLDGLRLADGTPWPIPFTLPVTIPVMAAALRYGAAALHDDTGRLRAIVEVRDAYVRDPREEARALYDTDDPVDRRVARLLARPAGTIGGPVTVLPAPGRPERLRPAPRDVRATARRQRWDGLRGIATLDGGGCLEAVGDRPALLPVPRVAVRRAPGRDAFLQAIVLKNFGAREVLFEHDRADWLAASPRVVPEDLGIAPIWILAARNERRGGHDAVA